MTDHRRMRRLGAAAALAAALGAAALPGPARAQFFGWGGWDGGTTWDGIGPQQAQRAVASRGFRVIAPLRRNGDVYVVEALDPRGQRERLIVAAADGAILQRFLVEDGRGRFRPDANRGYAVRGEDADLVPPADIPDVGRRPGRPTVVEPFRRYGDLTPDDGVEAAPARPRPQGPVRILRTHPPRVVERAPEAPAAREPSAVEPVPAAPRPVSKAPAPVASAPPRAEPTPQAAEPAPSAPQRRMADPLAIPDDSAAKPVRSVASGVTGTPAPVKITPAPAKPAPPPAKPADVPVAPLD